MYESIKLYTVAMFCVSRDGRFISSGMTHISQKHRTSQPHQNENLKNSC